MNSDKFIDHLWSIVAHLGASFASIVREAPLVIPHPFCGDWTCRKCPYAEIHGACPNGDVAIALQLVRGLSTMMESVLPERNPKNIVGPLSSIKRDLQIAISIIDKRLEKLNENP